MSWDNENSLEDLTSHYHEGDNDEVKAEKKISVTEESLKEVPDKVRNSDDGENSDEIIEIISTDSEEMEVEVQEEKKEREESEDKIEFFDKTEQDYLDFELGAPMPLDHEFKVPKNRYGNVSLYTGRHGLHTLPEGCAHIERKFLLFWL